MKSKLLMLILIVLHLFFPQCTGKSEDNKKSALYVNPVLDINFADPTVIRAPDGWFYVYATQSRTDDKYIHIQVARSKDLIEWEHLGDALPEKPVWATENQNFWAPHVHYDHQSETYFMYYSAYQDDGDGKCLAVATSENPEGPFIDKGEPMLCGEIFINIDPMTFDDPKSGKILMYWGSGFEPIKVRELTDDRLSFKPGTETVEVVWPGKDIDYNILVEGAWVNYRNDYYYLFYSGDNCCGVNANYAAMVARSKSPFGPFERLGEARGTGSSVILERSERWLAPGHNSVITDDGGNDWMFYHAIDTEDPNLDLETQTRRVMLMDKILYDEQGWPYIKDHKPSQQPVEGPIVDSK